MSDKPKDKDPSLVSGIMASPESGSQRTRLRGDLTVLTTLTGVIGDKLIAEAGRSAADLLRGLNLCWILDFHAVTRIAGSLRPSLTEAVEAFGKNGGAGIVAILPSQVHRGTLSSICANRNMPFAFAPSLEEAERKAQELRSLPR